MSNGWVDLHNHVIPGVDDGARDEAQALAAVGALSEEGANWVVATPHLDASLTMQPSALARRLDELDRGWARLQASNDSGVTLGRGAEIRLDVPALDLTDARLRLAGSRAVLVEFPYMAVPPRSATVIMGIRRDGFIPVIAHPERYHGVEDDLAVVATWLDAGGVLQVNTGSIVGRYGSRVRARALALLARGWVHCLASDYHANGSPGIQEVRRLLESWGNEEAVRLLFEENPSRLLQDQPFGDVPPLQPPQSVRSQWSRILPWRP